MSERTVRYNARRCPKDGAPLTWEQVAGMRTFYEAPTGHRVYTARCEKCRHTFSCRRLPEKSGE